MFSLVQEHLPSFLQSAQNLYRGGLPNYVKQEFRAYSRCGIHAFGFARARCEHCGLMLLVAFSCKKRGICPSCNARRMADTAARLVDRVLPDVRLRQWVLSIPFELRLILAKNPEALSAVGRLFIEEIFRWQRSLGIRLGLAKTSAAKEKFRGGAICFPQRFGGSLNLNVHYHVIVPDALFYRDTAGDLRKEVLRRPSRGELEDLTYNVSVRCLKWLVRQGYLKPEEAESEPTLLEMCLQSTVGLGPLAALSRKGVATVVSERGDAVKQKSKAGVFNIHVGEPARSSDEREQLIRYCARAPLSLERLSVSSDGKVVYQLKRPIRGKTHRVMEPHQFLARLCALIPPPRHPLIRFHGVFGPASKWRAEVVPQPSEPDREACTDEASNVEEECRQEAKWSCQRLDWARLLHRVYNIDALRCECGGRLNFEEVVEHPGEARAFLKRHNIKSPRESSVGAHVLPWSDAPNVALAWANNPKPGRTATDRDELIDEAFDSSTPYQNEHDFQDEIPSDDVYFHDEVPPD